MTKPSIPYRYLEVLAALAQNPAGLTTREIFQHAKSKAGSELPNEKAVHNIIYGMRTGSPQMIKRIERGMGVAYAITPAGQQRLDESLTDPADRLTLLGDSDGQTNTDSTDLSQGHAEDDQNLEMELDQQRELAPVAAERVSKDRNDALDETHSQIESETTPTPTQLPPLYSPAAMANPEQPLLLDPTYEIDALMIALYQRVSELQLPHSIERKAEKVALLERLENNDLFPGNVRALLAYIRADIQLMEDAA